jgi:Lrp/AsnC family transcriptional regulator for asnA, asnC and gidA
MTELTEIDLRILEILQDNARKSFSALSREIGIAESTVRYRIEKLRESGVITRFIALLDPRKIGYEITAIGLIKVDADQLSEASKVLAGFHEARHVFRSTGQYDLVAVIHAKNITGLNSLIEKIKTVPGVREAVVEVATSLVKVESRFNLRI